MYYEFEGGTIRWYASLGAALEASHKSGRRLVRVMDPDQYTERRIGEMR